MPRPLLCCHVKLHTSRWMDHQGALGSSLSSSVKVACCCASGEALTAAGAAGGGL